MLIESKAARRVKHAGNDGQAEPLMRQTPPQDLASAGTLRDSIALLQGERDFKESRV